MIQWSLLAAGYGDVLMYTSEMVFRKKDRKALSDIL